MRNYTGKGGDVVIPDGVTSIVFNGFNSSYGVTSVIIPRSVRSICYAAFEGCTKLTSITYNGTKEEWEAIKKNCFWKGNDSVLKSVVCTDGTVKA